MVYEKITDSLKVNTHCRLFRPISDRAFWSSLSDSAISYFEENLKLVATDTRAPLTASLYREFAVNGNRSNYENIYFLRRAELVMKVILECIRNDGRFLEDILDLTWMILEETTWTLPAHNREVSDADSLPDFKNHSLDLFLAETACTLAFVYQTVGEKLDELSRVVCRRIKVRLEHDVIDDYLARTDYWWMGFSGRIPNNWNPWINSNVLAVAITLEDDPEKLKKVVEKAAKTLDVYLKYYPEDGGCDEGPSYWNQAGLSMLECLWLLNTVSDGKINCFTDKKVINTSEYLMKMHTGGGKCVSFADSSRDLPIYPASMFKFGEIMGNQNLCEFAKHLYGTADYHTKNPGVICKSIRMYDIAAYFSKLENYTSNGFTPDLDYWFPSIEVLTSKTESDPEKGLFLAAKGGHNDESHNHNDIGNFIVYKDGTPFLIDSGNMTYSKITFSDKRYTLWTTRSIYHNTPSVADGEQLPGRDYASKDVSYKRNDDGISFSLDLKNTFSNRDDINKWVRTIEFNRKKQEITLTEDFSLSGSFNYTLNFLTVQNVSFDGSKIVLTAGNGKTLTIEFSQKLSFALEKIDCDDELIKKSWGDTLYRITASGNAKDDIIKYIIK